MIRRFNRYELKYILHREKLEGIFADLKDIAKPDPHGGENGYRVASLYYDSPDYECYWCKIEGIKFRRKLRMRIYLGNEGEDIEQTEHCMVEIKQRINRTVQKRRLLLDLSEAERLCQGQLPKERWDALDAMDQQVAAEVQYLVNAMNLRPTCITAYRRLAYVGGDDDAGLRITFDTDLRYRVDDLRLNGGTRNLRFAPADRCIMEVKVNERIPDWVTYLLARHQCQLIRVSKYCESLAASTLVPVVGGHILLTSEPSCQKVDQKDG